MPPELSLLEKAAGDPVMCLAAIVFVWLRAELIKVRLQNQLDTYERERTKEGAPQAAGQTEG